MCDAEEAAQRTQGRIAGIEAARDVFYEGEIAHRIVDFIQQNPVHGCQQAKRTPACSQPKTWPSGMPKPLTPASANYRGLDVFKCGPWTQGPVFLQQLTSA